MYQMLSDSRFCRRYGPFWTNKLNDEVGSRLLQPLGGVAYLLKIFHSVILSALRSFYKVPIRCYYAHLHSGPSPNSFYIGT